TANLGRERTRDGTLGEPADATRRPERRYALLRSCEGRNALGNGCGASATRRRPLPECRHALATALEGANALRTANLGRERTRDGTFGEPADATRRPECRAALAAGFGGTSALGSEYRARATRRRTSPECGHALGAGVLGVVA